MKTHAPKIGPRLSSRRGFKRSDSPGPYRPAASRHAGNTAFYPGPTVVVTLHITGHMRFTVDLKRVYGTVTFPNLMTFI